MSLSDYIEVKILDHIRGGTAFTQPAGIFAKLHLADPGEAGTTSPAATTTRVACTFGAASAGAMTDAGPRVWATVANAETVTHLSFWDASTAGNCLGSGALSASAILAVGDTLSVTNIVWSLD